MANCASCHTMHASENGVPQVVTGPQLLKFATATDACLSCHASDLGSAWGSDPLHPPAEKGAGNFVYLSSANLNDGPAGATNPIMGSHAGHSIISDSRGTSPDPSYQTAPGGTYPSSALGCTSCHNPHGNTNYRMLYGQGHVQAGDFQFVNPAPQAQGISIVSGAESPTNHAAYLSGMTAWCANCHGTYHQNSLGAFQHPVDITLGRDIAMAYNGYGGSSNPTGGNLATAYLPSVPFEDPAAAISATTGPTLASRISCISCHRSHGSSGPYAGRWDFNVTYLQQDGLISGSFPIPNPFGFADQRSLCCKCHTNGETHGGTQSCISCHLSNTAAAKHSLPVKGKR
ncbi:MAG TPA: cytochrome c3 family protein [bacterium]